MKSFNIYFSLKFSIKYVINFLYLFLPLIPLTSFKNYNNFAFRNISNSSFTVSWNKRNQHFTIPLTTFAKQFPSSFPLNPNPLYISLSKSVKFHFFPTSREKRQLILLNFTRCDWIYSWSILSQKSLVDYIR